MKKSRHFIVPTVVLILGFLILPLGAQPQADSPAAEKGTEHQSEPSLQNRVKNSLNSLRNQLKDLSPSRLASSTKTLMRNLPDLKDIPIDRLFNLANEAAASLPIDLLTTTRWDYKIVDQTETDPAKLESELRTIGNEGWECFFVSTPAPGKTRFFFKKKPTSVVRTMLITESLVKLLTGAFGGEEE